MTDLPAWVSRYANLDDTALAALGNRGLVRRAAAEVSGGRVLLAQTTDEVITFEVGDPPYSVLLLPSGPTTAQCRCPVATTCLHILAACLWLRQTHATVAPEGPGTARLLDHLLTWDPAEVNRSVGIAAVRRVAPGLRDTSLDTLAADSAVEDDGTRITITWPGSPTIVIVRGTAAADILVSGTHSAVTAAGWRLAACVRLFAMAGRAWSWPVDVTTAAGLQPNQRTALTAITATIEALIDTGLAHTSVGGADRLAATGQRAALEGLPLLARRVAAAGGTMALLARRDDATSDGDALTSLASAWALATGLGVIQGPPPPTLVGGSDTVATAIEALIPLGGQWWSGRTGRGLTLWFFDPESGLTESVTAGRAAGADPSFRRSGALPLVWTTPTDHLMRGPLQVRGVERRVDGTLSPTSRTVVGDVGRWGVPLPALATRVAATSSTASVLILSSSGVGSLDLDEVSQEVVWTITTADGSRYDLRMDVGSPAVETLTWVLARHTRLEGVTVVAGQPVGLWVRAGAELHLLVPTLARDPAPAGPRLRKRIEKFRGHQPATSPPAPTGPLERLVHDSMDLLTGVAATGGAAVLSTQQTAALLDRAQRWRELGLATAARALERVVTSGGAASTLGATVVIGRVADQLGALPGHPR